MKKLAINGVVTDVSSDGGTPLLWVIREELNMTGTKFGCGQGLCGACTVHVNGEAVRSCQTLVDDLEDGARVTTIEGLHPTGGHFAALEHPHALAADITKFFNDLRAQPFIAE